MLAPTSSTKIIAFPGSNRDTATATPALTPVLDVMPSVESRLEELAVIAPASPVSVLYVRSCQDGSYQFERLGLMLWRYLRPTDTLHRVSQDAWAIVLQGAGARTAGSIAARIEFELFNRQDTPEFEIGVATGTGMNSTALVLAASLSFPEAG
jgi:hypothetical protein